MKRFSNKCLYVWKYKGQLMHLSNSVDIFPCSCFLFHFLISWSQLQFTTCSKLCLSFLSVHLQTNKKLKCMYTKANETCCFVLKHNFSIYIYIWIEIDASVLLVFTYISFNYCYSSNQDDILLFFSLKKYSSIRVEQG